MHISSHQLVSLNMERRIRLWAVVSTLSKAIGRCSNNGGMGFEKRGCSAETWRVGRLFRPPTQRPRSRSRSRCSTVAASWCSPSLQLAESWLSTGTGLLLSECCGRRISCPSLALELALSWMFVSGAIPSAMQQLTTRAWTVPPSSALTSHHHTPDRLCRAAHDEQTCSNEPRANSAHPPMSCLCQRPPRNAVTHLDAPIQPPSPPDLDCSASPSPSVSPLFVQTCLSQCFFAAVLVPSGTNLRTGFGRAVVPLRA